ncbi:TPA: antitermination protein [Enterobacter hormaechei]|uniref:antitermination protein Q n=1 Tax=Enterobacter hormaechei TaxID=158836 RepID=UPI0007C6B193|nr:antitermination protein [Enterobacter cloacae]OAE72247.1 antitermination protein [Enterobacter cloacae]HBM7605707.1 antitermination protein [Enterobacter hormaechei subsp. xiangfangensis]HCR0210465.1 antitermination protein [Enterobacter hormaechei]HCR0977337.1 antitermination protein [Enterobacter hormaechei]
MNLEALPKFYSPKSSKLNDSTPATGDYALTMTDVMAAQGMVQAKASLGFNLFLAKMGIQDPAPAVDGLVKLIVALNNPIINKLSESTRTEIAHCLAQFVYCDYARSAASKCDCPRCSGQGVLRVVRDVVKHAGVKGVEPTIKEEEVEEMCNLCNGKGEVSTACRDCRGRGMAIDKKRTVLHGVPVQKLCSRCNGKGYSRLPTTLARAHVEKLIPDLTNYQWYNGYASVIDRLVMRCWQEEGHAEMLLKRITMK